MYTFQRVRLECVLQRGSPLAKVEVQPSFPQLFRSQRTGKQFIYFLDEVNLINLLKYAFNDKYEIKISLS